MKTAADGRISAKAALKNMGFQKRFLMTAAPLAALAVCRAAKMKRTITLISRKRQRDRRKKKACGVWHWTH